MSDVKRLKEKLRQPKPEPVPVDWSKGLSSGLTVVNLAMTGRIGVAYQPGLVYTLVGDSKAGKTWFVLQALAEVAAHPAYKDYRLVWDRPERGDQMDLEEYFGSGLVERLEVPEPSLYLESFYDRTHALFGKGPCVLGLDSEDVLKSYAAEKKVAKDRAGRAKGREVKGSYGDGKAKVNSAMLREAVNDAASTGSLLFLIKQTRDNIGLDAQFNPKVKSGGRAITFYSSNELWLSVASVIRRPVKGGPHIEKARPKEIGAISRVHVKKNRLSESGFTQPVEVIHYRETGLDDVGSNVHFLIKEGHWKGSADPEGKVKAPEFDYEGSRNGLVELIEEKGQERDLVDLVKDVWDSIGVACEVKRKKRYV